jgi:hypothetical protein
MKWLLLILLVALSSACVSTKRQDKAKLNTYKLSPQFKSEWNRDKNGCLGLRCKYTDIISSNNLIVGMPKEIFLDIFGDPDDFGADRNILLYYLCTECDSKKKVSKESDSSWMIFYFREERLEKCTLQIN